MTSLISHWLINDVIDVGRTHKLFDSTRVEFDCTETASSLLDLTVYSGFQPGVPPWGNEATLAGYEKRTALIKNYSCFCRTRPRAYLPVATDHGGWAGDGTSIGGMARKKLGTTGVQRL